MQQIHNLKHHLLIAMPQLKDSWFAGSVVYLCEYSDEGAMGLILNHSLDVSFKEICEQLDLPQLPAVNPDVLAGGPVRQEHGFILHREIGSWKSTLAIDEDVQLTSSKDILQAIAIGSGPRYYRIALGYAGWDKGQLDKELQDNAWLTVAASPELLFETPAAELYTKALAKLGVSIEFLSAEAGNA